MRPTGFILAKDEAANIARSVGALRRLGLDVVVLDSGSVDDSPNVAVAAGAAVEAYPYTTHLEAYRYLCLERTTPGAPVLVLDADMIVSPELFQEAQALLDAGADVVEAPIQMYWNGTPLRHASLCPPKAFMFRGGRSYFEPAGHGERLIASANVRRTRAMLGHDDRKPFLSYLVSQARYARSMLDRAADGSLTVRDRIRTKTPLLIAGTPLVSYLFRGEIGRAHV